MEVRARVARIARVNMHLYVRVCVCVRSAVWQGAKRLVPNNEVRMRRSCRNPETKDARRETEHEDNDDDDDDNGNMGVSGPRGHHFGGRLNL